MFVGQTITWEIDVPSDGWYQMVFRANQSFNQGMNSYRTIYIDGEIPFSEAKNMCFPYSQRWTVSALGGDSPYLLYLEKGTRVISMEVSAGETGDILQGLNQAVLDLNELSRRIMAVTGAEPDIYRDYQLEKQIPELIDALKYLVGRLDGLSVSIEKLTGSRGSQAAVLDELAELLRDWIRSPHTIPERLSRYRTVVESVGSLLLQMSEQPLALDYIAFIPQGDPLPKADIGIIDKIKFAVKWFFVSFMDDYNSVGSTQGEGQAVKVWVASGRDQAQILSNMVNDVFTAETGIPVALSIVDTGNTLIQATLAGKGPDVALLIGQDVPVNLAMRGALVNLDSGAYD